MSRIFSCAFSDEPRKMHDIEPPTERFSPGYVSSVVRDVVMGGCIARCIETRINSRSRYMHIVNVEHHGSPIKIYRLKVQWGPAFCWNWHRTGICNQGMTLLDAEDGDSVHGCSRVGLPSHRKVTKIWLRCVLLKFNGS